MNSSHSHVGERRGMDGDSHRKLVLKRMPYIIQFKIRWEKIRYGKPQPEAFDVLFMILFLKEEFFHFLYMRNPSFYNRFLRDFPFGLSHIKVFQQTPN